jgi:hypothetical protein
MSGATEIEKKSLEAHVELCAQRYHSMNFKLNELKERVEKLDQVTTEIRDMVQKISIKNDGRLLNWAFTAMAGMVGVIGWLIATYVLNK